MSRFGSMTARFYARTALSTLLQDSEGVSTRVPVSGSTEMNMSAEGRTELLLPRDEHLGDLAVAGRVVMVGQTDALAPTGFTQVPFCLPFLIEKVEDLSPEYVRLEGPDLLSLLKDVTTHEPIGSGDDTASTVAVAVSDPATTTVGVGAPINNDSITLSSASGFEAGDEVRVELDGGAGTHVTVVTSVNPPAAPAGTIQIRDRMPYGASIGNTVERRRRKVQVAAGDGVAFATGVECRLVMDNGSTHLTLIEEDPDEDVITMRDGAPDGAAIGKAITATDFSEPSTSDVTQIVENLTTALPLSWDVEFQSSSYTGTAAGTYHAPQGDSLYDLLISTAKRSGEYFRLYAPAANLAPQAKLVWRRTFDYAGNGANLRLVMSSQSDIDNELLNPNRAIITGNVRRAGSFTPVTRVTPYAGDKRITLALCTEGAKLDALAVGMEVIETGLGLYTPAYVKNAAAETTWGRISRTVTFSDIRVETNKVREWQSAADSLLAATVHFLKEHGTGIRYQYEVEDVVSALTILPGQRVEMVYTAPDGSWSVNKTGANALYCTRVRARFEPPREEDGYLVGGVKLLTLTLVESPFDIPDIAQAAAGAISEVGRLARISGGATGGGSTTTVVTGGTATDHGTLSGLGDVADHPGYLTLDGTRTMTGDLVLEPGKRVDGVDVSAHAADPAAHHAPVTAANTGISVSGHSIGVALASPSALEIADGLRLAAAAVGNGLRLDNQVLSVRLADLSGLSLAGGALGLGTPGTLSVASASAVTATGHTHAVAASSAPGVSSQLLKTNTDGHLELRTLSIGTAADGVSALKVISPQANLYGLYLKQRGDQAAQLFRIEKSDGSALLLVTNDGRLESGNPGFVSGLTGWQIAPEGNAEFNNVRVRGELHATTFVADELHATGGTIQLATATNIAEPYGAYDNELGPIDSAATTYITVNGSWATGLSYFSQKDIIRIKSMGEVESGGSLYIPDIYLEVVAVSAVGDRNLAQGKPGRYALTCLRKSGGYEGYQIPTGSSVVLWTKSGQGTGAYKGNMLLTADLAQSPYMDVFTVDASRAYLAPWPGSGQTRTPPTIKPRVRVGNLDGVLGLPEQWGIAAGTDLSDTSVAAKYIVASDLGVTLRNIDLSMYSGADRIVHISPSGITLRNSTDVYQADRSIRWMKPSGAVVGALSVRNSAADLYYMELGIRPSFNDVLSNIGIRIYDDLVGSRIDLMADTIYTPGGISIAANLGVNGRMRAAGSLALSAVTTNPPGDNSGRGRIMLQESTGASTPTTGHVVIGLQTVAGVQKLYARFANGTYRELASA